MSPNAMSRISEKVSWHTDCFVLLPSDSTQMRTFESSSRNNNRINRDEAVYALAKSALPAWMQCPHEISMIHVAVSAALADPLFDPRNENRHVMSRRGPHASGSRHAVSSTQSCVESLRRRFLGKHSRDSSNRFRHAFNLTTSPSPKSSQSGLPSNPFFNASRATQPSQQLSKETMVPTLLDANFSCIREQVTETWTSDAPRESCTRSRAIAIKPKTRLNRNHSSFDTIDDDDYLTNSLNSDKMYDWATWRLYHRIVDHRQKYPVSTLYYESDSSSDSIQENITTSGDRRFVSNPSIKPDPFLRESDSAYDGEVFELEI